MNDRILGTGRILQPNHILPRIVVGNEGSVIINNLIQLTVWICQSNIILRFNDFRPLNYRLRQALG